MSNLHKLAEITITIEGLPEYTGTRNVLEELADGASALISEVPYKELIEQRLVDIFPELIDKIEISIAGT